MPTGVSSGGGRVLQKTTEALGERQWRRIERAIREGKCVLVLGPDASVDSRGNLYDRLAERLGDEADADADAGQTFAALSVLETWGDEASLWDEVERFFAEDATETPEFHRALARVPFDMILQCSPDDMLTRALVDAGRAPSGYYCHLNEGAIRARDGARFAGGPDPAEPLLVHLCGIGAEGDSVVVTEADLLDFLVLLAREHARLPAPLLARLCDPQSTLLFLGFGLHRWYQRMLLHILRGDAVHSKRLLRSIALEERERALTSIDERAMTFYDQEHAIDFAASSFESFARTLAERAGDDVEGGARRAAAKRPDAEAPTVFLCYDSRDEDLVERVAEGLRARGVATWRDHENLRGGEDWDRRARHVIGAGVDYFAVMQTEHVGRAESWANLEIDLALDRSRKMPDGWRFVLPCRFDTGVAPLPRLAHVHSLDIGSGVDALADLVLEDWRTNDRATRKREKHA